MEHVAVFFADHNDKDGNTLVEALVEIKRLPFVTVRQAKRVYQ